jgi:hypothetical protein
MEFDRLVVADQAVDAEIRALEEKREGLQDAPSETLLSLDYPAQVAAAEKLLADAGARKAALQKVADRQSTEISRIEGAIHAGRHAVFVAEIAAPQRRLNAAIEELLSAAAETAAVLNTHAPVSGSYVLFPSPDPSDIGAHSPERGMASGLFQQALRLAWYRENMYKPGHGWHAA